MINVICAIEHDGRNERILTLAFDVPSKEFDLRAAIQKAVKDFLSTEEGRRVWEYNCHSFNWADFAMNLGSIACQRYGFSPIGDEQCSDLIVNWDEDLTNGFDPCCEEDEEG